LHLVHDALTRAWQESVEENQPPHRTANSHERDDEASDGMPNQHQIRKISERLLDDFRTLDGPGCHVIGS